MKMKIILPVLLLTLLASACQSSAAAESSTVKTSSSGANSAQSQNNSDQESIGGARIGEEFTLAEGDSIWIEKGMFLITLDGVIEDSRCPMDVECFWEGNAKVLVRVGEDEYILTLGKLLEGDTNSIPLGEDLSLRLVEITPYPGSEQDGQPYLVTLIVEPETF